MRAVIVILLWSVLCISFIGSTAIAAEVADRQAKLVVKTYKGLSFRVPEDWPVEEIDGTVGPIPIEEYLHRKFEVVTEKMQKLESTVQGLDLRIKVLEAQKKRDIWLKSNESTPNET